MDCSQKTFLFLSVSTGLISISSDIVITLRKIKQNYFYGVCLKNHKCLWVIFFRCLRDVTKKTSFLRYSWEVLKSFLYICLILWDIWLNFLLVTRILRSSLEMLALTIFGSIQILFCNIRQILRISQNKDIRFKFSIIDINIKKEWLSQIYLFKGT